MTKNLILSLSVIVGFSVSASQSNAQVFHFKAPVSHSMTSDAMGKIHLPNNNYGNNNTSANNVSNGNFVQPNVYAPTHAFLSHQGKERAVDHHPEARSPWTQNQ